MIPQNFKDILGNVENAGLYQSLAMLLFIVFFLMVLFWVFSRSKSHYNDQAHTPLEDDNNDYKESIRL